MNRILLGAGLVSATLVPTSLPADVGPPAHLQIVEREAGLYSVQWRVPKVLPPRAIPSPDLPETCRPSRERTVTDQPGAWLFTRDWRCGTGLAGSPVGMRYRFPEFSLTTVVRVELLSGDSFAHVLAPGEGPWRLPVGTAPPDLLRDAARATWFGISHVSSSPIHLAFVLALGLLGGVRRSGGAVSGFTLAQIAGALLASVGPSLGAVPAEGGLAVAVTLLAREALRPADERRRVTGLASAAGFLHGLGLSALLAPEYGEHGAGLGARMLAIVGMDSAHLVGAIALAYLGSRLGGGPASGRLRTAVVYGAGCAGAVLVLALITAGGAADSAAVPPRLPVPDRSGDSRAGTSGSRRVAPTSSDAPIQSYLAVEPFELRHEAMLRLSGLAGELGLDPDSSLEISDQPALLDRLESLVLGRARVRADGTALEGSVRRVDFMTVDATGALPRVNPRTEPVGEAIVGVVVSYPTAGVPQKATLSWDPFPTSMPSIPTTVIDPESVRSVPLTAERPSLTWENTLAEDPIPTVTAVRVEPTKLSLPLLSCPLLGLSVVVLGVGIRRRRFAAAAVFTRILVAAALVVGPWAQVAVALPGSAGTTPSERQARRILAGLLPNTYRAMEFRNEAQIFDRLAVSVTGDTLTDVYLEQRKALEMEDRGGARARVEAVEVLKADEILSREPGFEVRARWSVGGMVTHFGHRHFRQNRYDARLGIAPVDGVWKIRSIDVLEQERVR